MAHIIHQYTQHLLNYAASQQLDADLLQERFNNRGLYKRLSTAESETTFIDLIHFSKMADFVASQLQDPLFFLKFGNSLDISCHGFLGYAAKSAQTVREAILIDCELLHTRITAFDMKLEEVNETLSAVRFYPVDLANADEASVFELIAGTFATMSTQLLNLPSPPFEVNSAYGARTHGDDYEGVTHCKWQFHCEYSEFVVPTSLLNLNMPHQDPTLKQLAKNECEKLLNMLPQNKAYAVLVSKVIRSTLENPKPVDEIADCLHVSSRTLKRKLKDEGTSYTDLHKKIRYDEAQQLLAKTNRTIEQIAFDLGFSSAANFISTYKRWAGESPSVYRKSQQ